jgi:hypothetical protein
MILHLYQEFRGSFSVIKGYGEKNHCYSRLLFVEGSGRLVKLNCEGLTFPPTVLAESLVLKDPKQ